MRETVIQAAESDADSLFKADFVIGEFRRLTFRNPYLGQRRGRVVPKQLHVIPQMTLVALQGQGVIAALLNHLLRHLTMSVHGIGGNHFAPQS